MPLRPRAKEPLISWVEYQKRIASAEEITSWFTATPDANVGIVTGVVSGLAVVDLDGPAGLTTGKQLRLTSPVSVRTGNGMQLYFRDSGTARNSVRSMPGLDIRGEGGYVVAPPSLHPNGKTYRWECSPLARHLLSEFPRGLVATFAGSTEARNEEGWIAKALTEMRPGNIDNTLFKISSRLRSDGYAAADALEILRPHALRAGATPGHLEDKIANVWRRYTADPNAAREGTKAQGLEEFLKDKQEPEWLCKPLIAKKSIGFVVGLPETSKTWLCVELAVELTRPTSGHLCGLKDTARARVLFIDQERFKGETQRRFSAVLAEKNLAASPDLFIQCGSSYKLNEDQSYQLFRQELIDLRPDIIIVDSFATFHSLEENSRSEIQKVFERIKALREEFGCAFAFIHHENKFAYGNGEPQGDPTLATLSGSGAIPAAAEFVLTVRKTADGSSIVHHTKSTLAHKARPFYISVVDTERGIAVRGIE